jgi:hypothetical protein
MVNNLALPNRRGKTTIVVSRKTHDALQALGQKGKTFDQVLAELLKIPDESKIEGEVT